jgi:hypothetical protein
MKRKTSNERINDLAKRILLAALRTPPRVSTNMSQGEQSARSIRYAQRRVRQEQRDAENYSINNNQGEVSVNDKDDSEDDNEGPGNSD